MEGSPPLAIGSTRHLKTRVACASSHFRLDALGARGCQVGTVERTGRVVIVVVIVVVAVVGALRPRRRALKQPSPPVGRAHRHGAVVQRRVHVGEKVVDVANNDAHDLVLGNAPVQDQADAHQHPWQVRRRKDHQVKKAEPCVGVASRPNVDECRGERLAEERHGDERGEDEQEGHGVEQQPRKNGRRPARRLFEEARVALEEIDVEDEVEGDGAEVEERGQEPPVLGGVSGGLQRREGGRRKKKRAHLAFNKHRAVAVKQLERCQDLALHERTDRKRRRRPPPCADGRLPEPLLERDEPAVHHLVHHGERGRSLVSVRGRARCVVVLYVRRSSLLASKSEGNKRSSPGRLANGGTAQVEGVKKIE